MTEKERGWYIAHPHGDEKYYLRCINCKKSILAITATKIVECAGFIFASDKHLSEQWRVMQICSGCQKTLKILYSDVSTETSYREIAPMVGETDLSNQIVSPTAKALIETAKKYAAADLKTNSRSRRGRRLEPYFWQITAILFSTNKERTFCCPPQHVLAQWKKVGDSSPTPVVYSSVDTVRLLSYLQRAVREAKAAGLDPLICDTDLFDDWIGDLSNSVI